MASTLEGRRRQLNSTCWFKFATDYAPMVSDSPTACSIAATLGAIGDRWTMLILREVFRGRHRFGEIHAELGIAKNLLSDRLSQLVEEEVLERVPYQDRPVRSEYRLTAKEPICRLRSSHS